jgi:hypothetical protein
MKNFTSTTILCFVFFQCLVSTSFAQDFSGLNKKNLSDKIECVSSGEKFAVNIDEMSFNQKEISNIEMMAIRGGDDVDGTRILLGAIIGAGIVYGAYLGAI